MPFGKTKEGGSEGCLCVKKMYRDRETDSLGLTFRHMGTLCKLYFLSFALTENWAGAYIW